MSATLRVSNPITLSPFQCSASGMRLMRPRCGLSPKTRQWAAGIRMEPPPSEAVAAATIPLATAAALPPLDPPGVRPVFQGFRVTPKAGPSVVPMIASSGVLVLPTTTAPAPRSRFTSSESAAARSP